MGPDSLNRNFVLKLSNPNVLSKIHQPCRHIPTYGQKIP